MEQRNPDSGPTGAARPNGPNVADIVETLGRDLARLERRRRVRVLVTVLALVLIGFGFVRYREATQPPPEPRFTLANLETRDVVEKVQSTGVVDPVTKVEVGAQVSGRVVDVLVDFNARVKRGELLAVVDPELFGAEVVQTRAELTSAEATLRRAEAQRDAAKVRLERMRSLVQEQVASTAELDQVQADADIASAEVGSAEAQIARVRARLTSVAATLAYTKIFSPIDGVVIDRRVEPGQTVASSFNTPVLFVIAHDLTKMRVLAEIDEADVGKVKEGMAAEVVVDAFPDARFEGVVTQVRLSPNTVEGVVTYAAVIIVDNPDSKLRPGMTATSTLVAARADGVLAVRNSALRFEPLPPLDSAGKPLPSERSGPVPGPGEGRVFLAGHGPAEDPGLTPLLVQLGISDGVWTEVKGGIAPETKVIVDERPSGPKKGFRLF